MRSAGLELTIANKQKIVTLSFDIQPINKTIKSGTALATFP